MAGLKQQEHEPYIASLKTTECLGRAYKACAMPGGRRGNLTQEEGGEMAMKLYLQGRYRDKLMEASSFNQVIHMEQVETASHGILLSKNILD